MSTVRAWPDPGCEPHVHNPRANAHRFRDPLAIGCCQWAAEHPVHVTCDWCGSRDIEPVGRDYAGEIGCCRNCAHEFHITIGDKQ